MLTATLKESITEAKRFLNRAEDLLAKSGSDKYVRCDYPKESGAVRRASLDLTRVLADLRHNR